MGAAIQHSVDEFRGKAIVVTSGKGGVGKTTTTANMGSALAMHGSSVCMIDADIGLHNLDLVLGLENRVVYDIIDLVQGKCKSIRQALVKHKKIDNLFLLPASKARENTDITVEQMVWIVNQLKRCFDFILIDCPAGIDHGFELSVAAADEAWIVTRSEVAAIRDADKVIGRLAQVGIFNPQLILNCYKPEMARHQDMLDLQDLKDILNIDIIGILPESKNVIISSNRGVPVVMDEASFIGNAFHRIAQRVLGFEVPFENFENRGFFTRLKEFMGMGRNA